MELGMKVKARLSNFTGVIVGIHQRLDGPNRYEVQAQDLSPNGTIVTEWFYSEELKTTS